MGLFQFNRSAKTDEDYPIHSISASSIGEGPTIASGIPTGYIRFNIEFIDKKGRKKEIMYLVPRVIEKSDGKKSFLVKKGGVWTRHYILKLCETDLKEIGFTKSQNAWPAPLITKKMDHPIIFD